MRIVAVLLVILSLLWTSAALAQIPDDKLIVPGQRIGRWTLDMLITDIARLNGPPAAVKDLSGGDTIAATFYFWDDFVAVTRDRSRIEYLYTLPGSDFKTEKGIGYQSTRRAVESAYGGPTAVSTPPGILMLRLIYNEIGLAVHLTLDNVSSIMVFRPGSARSHWRF